MCCRAAALLNAFAARFLGHHFVVLLSGVVDAMQPQPTDGVRFYIGHELGHIKRGHALAGLLRLPVLWLPLIGAPTPARRKPPATCTAWPAAVTASPLPVAGGPVGRPAALAAGEPVGVRAPVAPQPRLLDVLP